MTFEDFISKWNGKPCEMGGSANAINQCVDLANAYITEVLDFPAIFWTNAQDFPSKGGGRYDFIANTPTGVPEKGDIMIWKSPDNVGHVAIFIEGDQTRFKSFDQNFPLGTPCHIQSHTYNTKIGLNVIGWMRAKKPTEAESTQVTELQKELDEKKIQVGNLQGQVNQLLKQNEGLSSELGNVRSESKAKDTKIESQIKIIEEYTKEDAVQIRDLKESQSKSEEFNNRYFEFLQSIRSVLKLSSSIGDVSEAENESLEALQNLYQSKVREKDLSEYKLLLKIGDFIWRR